MSTILFSLVSRAAKTHNIAVELNAFVGNEINVLCEAGNPKYRPVTWQSDSISPEVYTIKDNIATLYSKTTCASQSLDGYQSPFEATVLQKLKTPDKYVQQPTVQVGKSNMDEFGMGSHSTTSFFGRVHNTPPFSHLSAGGSSGGSAVAVASGMVDIALGTDTGGSVRLPAAYTGVVGFKPSYGAVSRFGLIPYANSLETVGILGKDVDEILQDEYKAYARQMQSNAQAMAQAFLNKGYDIVSGGTDNHLLLIDLRNKNISGKKAENTLVKADITINKNMVPFDDKSPFVTSGIRIGVPAITTRGLKENDMAQVVNWLDNVLASPDDETVIARVRGEVNEYMKGFALYPEMG